MLYEIEENNYPDWLDKVPWYSTSICSKLHGKLFEDFIIHARIDRYNLTCYIISHDKNNLHMKMKKAVLYIGQYLRTQQQKYYKHWVLS